MNRLSSYLPDGIWFNSMFINSKSLTLRCSVVSLQREEMSLITDFINRLKQDKDFFSGFSGLELSSVEKRTLGVYDIVDFSLTANIKTAEPAVVAKPRPAATKK
jgi:hypothetical protein